MELKLKQHPGKNCSYTYINFTGGKPSKKEIVELKKSYYELMEKLKNIYKFTERQSF